MGRLGHDPVIQHFSHPHPLELSNLQQALAPSTCSGCKLRASGYTYACKACNYFLHTTCAQMPQYINHPADPSHPLALLSVPAYAEGFFNCDACGQKGTGFSYHCGVCDLDVHTLCASMPLSLTHQAHHHPLGLAFFPPYENKGFSCDICGNMGTRHWLYRCAVCEFDAHLNCATTKPRQQAPAPQPQNYRVQQQPRAGGFPTVGAQQYVQQRPQFRTPVVGVPTGTWQTNNPGGVPPQGNNNQAGNGLVGQIIQGFVQGAAEQAGQNFVQSIFGGGGGGGGNNGDGGAGGNGDGGQDGSSHPVLSVIGSVFGGGGGSDNSS